MKLNPVWLAALIALAALLVGGFALYQGFAQPHQDSTLSAQSSDEGAESGDSDSEDKTGSSTEGLGEIPAGETTDDGLEFSIPFERGNGSAVFSRQNGLLRVDLNVRLPFNAGTGRQPGSSASLFLSVDGNHGRRLSFSPALVWVPPADASLPAFRIEASYARDREASRIADEPSFVGEADVSHWARWTATLWIDRRRLLVAGNSPGSLAENWHAGFVMGNSAARAVYPEGMDRQNPANTPTRMVRFRFSDLPEREELDESPRDRLTEREKDMFDAMKGIAASWNARNAVNAFTLTQAANKNFPDALWPKALQYIISYVAATNNLNEDGLDGDYLKFLKTYVEAAPGQSQQQLTYLNELLAADRLDEAVAQAKSIFESPLCTEREETAARMRLEWASRLIQWGYVERAAELMEALSEEGHMEDERVRIEFKLQKAALAEREGDSETAVKVYEGIIADEQDALDSGTFQRVQQLLQIQKEAVRAWEKEAEYRESDKEKTNPRLVMETDKGRVVIELFEDDSPNTVASLVKLAGEEFYHGLNFHRIEPGFVAQGGCPNGNGSGDAGYKLKFEENERTHFRGSVAMARAQDKDSAGSQFYVCLSNGPSVINLNGNYQVVGRVIEGMEVMDRIRKGDKIKSVKAENLRDHKYEPDVIK